MNSLQIDYIEVLPDNLGLRVTTDQGVFYSVQKGYWTHGYIDTLGFTRQLDDFVERLVLSGALYERRSA